MSKNSAGVGLEGNSVILSLVHPHLRDVDAADGDCWELMFTEQFTITTGNALTAIPDFILTITFLVGTTIIPILEQKTVFEGIYNLPNATEHRSQ